MDILACVPYSGILLTDQTRVNCSTYAQGKQSIIRQSTGDTGANSPIDRIGGIIFSDLKGPMTPRNRLGNNYMINFVDHKINHVKVSFARPKIKRTYYSKIFWFSSRSGLVVEFTSFVQTLVVNTRISTCFVKNWCGSSAK